MEDKDAVLRGVNSGVKGDNYPGRLDRIEGQIPGFWRHGNGR
jgi:hypothetical protein